jgi:hypothetical protein
MSRLNKRCAETAMRICIAVAALLTVPAVALAADYTLKTTVTITGNALTSFDISWVDPHTHSYTLSDRSNAAVDVIDTRTLAQTKLLPGKFAGLVSTIGGVTCPPNACDGPNGNLVFNNKGVDEVWAGDGATQACTGRESPTAGIVTESQIQALNYSTNCSTVKVINLKTGALITEIATGGLFRADELCYDPVDHLIQIANDSDLPSPYISFISTDTYKVVKQINFDGLPGDGPNATNGIEQCKWNQRKGLIYLNIPEVNGNGNDIADGHTVIIDPRKMEIVDQIDIPVAECAGPQGMALGPAPEILLGCNAKGPPDTGTGSAETGTGPQNAAVLDENTGELLVLPNQGGNDEVWFNPGNGLYFLAEGQNAAQEQLGVVSSRHIRTLQDVFVSPGGSTGRAHSVAADPDSNEVFLPIPNNAGSTLCPMAADGCIAVFWQQYPH